MIMTSSGRGTYDFTQSAQVGDKRGAQEVEEESIHLQWAVFRNPVARVRQALHANEIRHPEAGRLSEPPAQEPVPLAPDYEHRSLYPLQHCPRLPLVPQDGAIVVEGCGERPWLRNRLYVPLYVLGGERLRLYRVTTENGAQEGEVTCSDNLLRQPRDLKEEYVRAPQQLPRFRKPIQGASRVGNVEDREPFDATGVAHRRDPGGYSAPIVPDHGSRPFPAGRYQALHIARQQLNAVCAHSGRFVREVVAAHVRGNHAEAGLDQRRDLVPPLVPELREAVQQQHERSLARLDVVQPHISEVGIAVRQLHPAQRLVGHAPPLPSSATSQTVVEHRATPSTSTGKASGLRPRDDSRCQCSSTSRAPSRRYDSWCLARQRCASRPPLVPPRVSVPSRVRRTRHPMPR